jgi:multidrug efflux pump
MGELPRIVELLPEGMSVNNGYDSSVFIARSIENVFRTIGEAIVLVVLVIFVFLRSLRATLVPLVTIPVSLIGVFTVMLLFGFSINTLTLLALVLAVGLVVDDAIVMLENIARYVEKGEDPFTAAIKGAKEITFAIIAMTITLAAVYAPIAFQTGRTGRLFIEFALTLAGAVIVSGFVALTLSPMMCSLLLRHQPNHGAVYRAGERVIEGMNALYRRSLTATLTMRAAVGVAYLVLAAFIVVLVMGLPRELSPSEDRGSIIGIGVAPEGSTKEFTDTYARRMEAVYRTVPQMDAFFMVVGFPTVSNVISFIRLKDWDQRKAPGDKQQAIVGAIAPRLFGGIPGILAFAVNPPSLGQSPIDKPVNFVLQTSAPYAELQRAVDQMLAAARQNPRLQNLDTDLKLNKPELKVSVDRDKAAGLGIEVETIGRTLETMLGGRQVTRFKRGKQYDVVVQVADVDRRTRAT